MSHVAVLAVSVNQPLYVTRGVVQVSVSQLLSMAPVLVSVNVDQPLFTACVIMKANVNQPLCISVCKYELVFMNMFGKSHNQIPGTAVLTDPL